MSQWRAEAVAAIAAVHDSLPEHMTYQERAKALRGTCPFPTGHNGFRVWSRERARYLNQYRPSPGGDVTIASYDAEERAAMFLWLIEE